MEERTLAQIDQFIEGLGLAAQADGLPRIAGRMIGLFVVHGGPFSFSEIAEKLQISRGSVSTNARILSALGMLEKVSRPGDRQDYYKLASKPFTRLLEGYAHRMSKMVKLVDDVQGAIPEEEEGIHSRISDMGRFYRLAVSNTDTLIALLESEDE